MSDVMTNPGTQHPDGPPTTPTGQMVVTTDGKGWAHVVRDTAESQVRVSLAMPPTGTTAGPIKTHFDVAESIDVSAFPGLLQVFCTAAGMELDVSFTATKLSSSHVVLEDTGLAMGAALFALLTDAMASTGVNGAGSSIKTADDFHSAPISASISVEGRKFLKIVSATDMDDLRWRTMIGHTVFDGVWSEDVDDFIDAIAGGMRASLFLHEREKHDDPDAFWRAAIIAFGVALAEVFAPNSARRGLPPGVKATLF